MIPSAIEAIEKSVADVLRALGSWTGFSVASDHIRIYLPDLTRAAELPKRIAGLEILIERMPVFEASIGAVETVATAVPATELARFLKASDRLSAKAGAPEPRVGCIGAFIKSDDVVWLLTANHVVAGNGSFLPFDAGNPERGVFAGAGRILVSKTVAFSKIRGTEAGGLDAAVCKLESSDVQLSSVLHAGMKMLEPNPAQPREGAEVVFRTPEGELRTARIREASATLNVRMNIGGLGVVSFPKHLMIEGAEQLIDGGESGGLVMQRDNGRMQPLGILVGFPEGLNERHRAVVCPLSAIFADPRIKAAIREADSIIVP